MTKLAFFMILFSSLLFANSISRDINQTYQHPPISQGTNASITIATPLPTFTEQNMTKYPNITRLVMRETNLTIEWAPSSLAAAQVITIKPMWYYGGRFTSIGSMELNSSYLETSPSMYFHSVMIDTNNSFSKYTNKYTIPNLRSNTDYNISIVTIDRYDNNFTSSIVGRTLTNTVHYYSLKPHVWNMISLPLGTVTTVRKMFNTFNNISDIWTYHDNSWDNGYKTLDTPIEWQIGMWVKPKNISLDINITNTIAYDLPSPTTSQRVTNKQEMVDYIKNTIPNKQWVFQGIGIDINSSANDQFFNKSFLSIISSATCPESKISVLQFDYSRFSYGYNYNDGNGTWHYNDFNITSKRPAWIYKNCP